MDTKIVNIEDARVKAHANELLDACLAARFALTQGSEREKAIALKILDKVIYEADDRQRGEL